MWEIFDCSKFKFRTFQYFAAIGGNMGMISLGMHYGWASRVLPVMTGGNHPSEMTSPEGSSLVAMIPLGSLVGDVLALLTLHQVGHNKLITLTSSILSLSWLMMALAPSKIYMFVGRFLGGVADGVLFTALPPYLAEIAEPAIRGFLGATYMVSMALGMLLINAIFFLTSVTTAAFVASAISLLTLVVFPFLPESPYFYLMKKDVLAAKASLQKFNGKGEVVEELYRISKGIMEQGDDDASIKELFCDKHYRKSFLVALMACQCQYLSGAIAIQSYTTTVFEESSRFIAPKIANLIFFGVFFVATCVTQLIVDYAGRRPLMLVSTGMVGLMLFLDGTYLYIKTDTDIDTSGFDFIQLVVIIVYTVFYGCGLHTVPLIVASEILPSKIKIIGFFFLNSSFTISSVAVLEFFSWTKDSFGIFVPFYCFGCVCAVNFVLLVLFLPETKKKTLENIQADIRGCSGNQ